MDCVVITGFGFITNSDIPQWVEQFVQEDGIAIEIAEKMIAGYPWDYAWNEGGDPSYYMEFSISNLDEFRSQLEAFKNA